MADVGFQSGQLSALYAGLQSDSTQGTNTGTPGTQASAAILTNPISFDIDYSENPLVFEQMTGQLDSEGQVRVGLENVTGPMSLHFSAHQPVPFIKGAMGQEILSGSGATSFGTVTTTPKVPGDQTTLLSAPIPAVPVGSDWYGAIATVGTGGTAEDVMIFSYSGSTIKHSPYVFSHATSETVSVAKQHFLHTNSGSSRANFDFFSFYAQYGALHERQFVDMRVEGFSIKQQDEKLTTDFTLGGITRMFAETATQTAAPAGGTGEANDGVFTSLDGGLYAYRAAADTVPSLYKNVSQMTYNYQIQTSQTRVGGQPAVQRTPSKRMQDLSFTEYAGQGGKLSPIYTDFVRSQTTTPVFLWWKNSVTGYSFGVYMPTCKFIKYKTVGPTANPIAYQGQIKPFPDLVNRLYPCKVVVKNSRTTTY